MGVIAHLRAPNIYTADVDMYLMDSMFINATPSSWSSSNYVKAIRLNYLESNGTTGCTVCCLKVMMIRTGCSAVRCKRPRRLTILMN